MSLFQRIKAIAKDSAIYGISQVLSQLVGFLLLPLYTQYLTPHDYGVLAMLGLIPIFLPAFVNLGLNNAVFRFYRQAKTAVERAELVGTSHRMVLYFSTIILGFLFLFSQPINVALTNSDQNLTVFQISLISSWLIALSTIPMVVLKQERKVKQIALRSFIGLAFNVLVTVILVVHAELGVLGAVIGTLVGSIITAALVLRFIPAEVWKSFNLGRVNSLLKYSLPFVPYYLQSVLMGIIGQYLVKEYLGLEEAGYYSIAWRFSLPLVLALNAVNNSWAAIKFDIRYGDQNPKKSYREIFSVYISFVAICWLLISIWMPELMKLVLSAEFHSAEKLIPLVSLIPVIQYTRGMLTTGFEMAKSPQWVALIPAGGLICMILLALNLSDFGVKGVVIAVVAGWVVTAILTFIYSYVIYPISYDWNLVGLIIVFSILCTLVKFPAYDLILRPVLITVGLIGIFWVINRERLPKIISLLRSKFANARGGDS